jgi:hypothetical protein
MHLLAIKIGSFESLFLLEIAWFVTGINSDSSPVVSLISFMGLSLLAASGAFLNH